MAANNLTFQIALEQNINDDSTACGKYYGVVYNQQNTLSLRGLIERVAFDQSIYTRDVIEGVVGRLTEVMVELITSGQSVKWDGLGTFQPRLESVGRANVNAFNAATDIKGVHIRFIPENSKGEQLTSRKFRDMCNLELVGIWEKSYITIGNKRQVVRTFYTMQDWQNRQQVGV